MQEDSTDPSASENNDGGAERDRSQEFTGKVVSFEVVKNKEA
jgi:hypothetical protein